MASKEEINSLTAQVKRYIIIGSENALYSFGDRVTEPKFRPKTLAALNELYNLKEVNAVAEAIRDCNKLALHDEASLAYLLALCVKSEHEQLRKFAYMTIPNECSSSKTLFLLIKFVRDLDDNEKLKGFGGGLKKAVAKWYLLRGKQLAETLIRERQFYGFNHRDILRLSHFNAPRSDVEAVINHFVFSKEVTLPKELQQLSSNLKELKTTEDALKAAFLLSELKLDPSFVPDRFQKSPEMWADYVKGLPIMEILYKLEYFAASRKLSTAVHPVVLAVLNDCDGSDLDPGEVYLALKRYQVCANFLRKDKAITKRRADAAAAAVAEAAEKTTAALIAAVIEKPKGTVKVVGPKADPDVVNAVVTLLGKSIKKLPSGATRWVMGLELLQGGSGAIGRLQGLNSAGASALILQWLLQTGKVAAVVTSDKTEVKPNKGATVADVTAKITEVKSEANKFSLAIKNATTQKIKVDSFVIISDRKQSWSLALAEGFEALKEYRKALNRPQARLVVVFLRCGRELTLPDDSGVLTMNGFDARIPKLIDAFGKGLF